MHKRKAHKIKAHTGACLSHYNPGHAHEGSINWGHYGKEHEGTEVGAAALAPCSTRAFGGAPVPMPVLVSLRWSLGVHSPSGEFHCSCLFSVSLDAHCQPHLLLDIQCLYLRETHQGLPATELDLELIWLAFQLLPSSVRLCCPAILFFCV